jgi:hypothetical protein
MRTTRPTDPCQPSRRRWRIAGISHATVVAYLALFMAMGGTAFAATGGTFILGKSNKADQVTTLTSTTGTALSLKSPSGKAPLAVNRSVVVKNLNADLLDGYHASGLARLGTTNTGARTTFANPDGIPLRLTPKAGSAPLQTASSVKVANLNADLLDGKDSTAFVPKAQYDELVTRVSQLEKLLAGVTRVQADGQPTLRIAGVNVQIVNGSGITHAPNGVGNLIIGYSAQRHPVAARSGSHYLVLGDAHEWTSFGGILAGWDNTSTASGASVIGGQENTAAGELSTVLGGGGNTATGMFSVVVGGDTNTASGILSSVTGGAENVASGVSSSVSGGAKNTATYYQASAVGGHSNTASGTQSSILGGENNIASGSQSSILGGSNKTVAGALACHPNCS